MTVHGINYSKKRKKDESKSEIDKAKYLKED